MTRPQFNGGRWIWSSQIDRSRLHAIDPAHKSSRPDARQSSMGSDVGSRRSPASLCQDQGSSHHNAKQRTTTAISSERRADDASATTSERRTPERLVRTPRRHLCDRGRCGTAHHTGKAGSSHPGNRMRSWEFRGRCGWVDGIDFSINCEPMPPTTQDPRSSFKAVFLCILVLIIIYPHTHTTGTQAHHQQEHVVVLDHTVRGGGAGRSAAAPAVGAGVAAASDADAAASGGQPAVPGAGAGACRWGRGVLGF